MLEGTYLAPSLRREISGDAYNWYVDEDIEVEEASTGYSSQLTTSQKTERYIGSLYSRESEEELGYGAWLGTHHDEEVDRDITPYEENKRLYEIKHNELSYRHRQILVWTDGTDPYSTRSLIDRISNLNLPHFSVQEVNRENFTNVIRTAYARETVLILPGGTGKQYDEALKPFNQLRAAFHDNGGSEIGFCAGGFYGVKFSHYLMPSGEVLYREREVWYLDGEAKGPKFPMSPHMQVLAPSFMQSITSSAISPSLEHRIIRLCMQTGIEGAVSCGDLDLAGGGFFVPSADLISGKDFQPILLYKAENHGEEGQIAALRVSPTKPKRGNWVGCMVHPEYDIDEVVDFFSENRTLRDRYPNTVKDIQRVRSYDPDFQTAKSASELALVLLLEAGTQPTSTSARSREHSLY